jgi:hypothetical protein
MKKIIKTKIITRHIKNDNFIGSVEKLNIPINAKSTILETLQPVSPCSLVGLSKRTIP